MTPTVSIVIPTRPWESVTLTVESLLAQTFQDFELHVIVDTAGRGAPWARNQGAERARGRYLLFSDNDIRWRPEALAEMVTALLRADDGNGWMTGYAYGSYELLNADGSLRVRHGEPWDLDTLKGRNYISTMSLMERDLFPGFDESLRRLQDWDLWLRLALEHKVRGVWVDRVLFTTAVRPGITFGGPVSYEDARTIVRRKHELAP